MADKRKVALVTGASGGIGTAIALRLAREGVFVIATSRDVARGRALCDEIEAAGGASVALALDVGKADSIRSLAARLGDCGAEGPVSWLVNNAGVALSAPLLAPESEALSTHHMQVNFHGPRRLIEVLAPEMVAAGYGRIVNIASSAGLRGYAYVAAYCASKHALVGYSRAAALELGPKGVFVNLVAPHYVDTPMTAEAITRLMEKTGRSEEQARRFFEEQNPGGRLVTVYEVADAVWELCAGEDNGCVVSLDGS